MMTVSDIRVVLAAMSIPLEVAKPPPSSRENDAAAAEAAVKQSKSTGEGVAGANGAAVAVAAQQRQPITPAPPLLKQFAVNIGQLNPFGGGDRGRERERVGGAAGGTRAGGMGVVETALRGIVNVFTPRGGQITSRAPVLQQQQQQQIREIHHHHHYHHHQQQQQQQQQV